MNVVEAVDRIRQAHLAVGLGAVGHAGPRVEATLAQIASAVAPLRLPADLVTFWRSVDPDTLALAPCPRPASAELSLRLWREHLAGTARRTPTAFFPWCYESGDFGLVELVEPGAAAATDPTGRRAGGCFSWTGPGSPAVRIFSSVTAYLDLLATMVELGELTFHSELGVVEFDPGRRWQDAQVVRLAAEQRHLLVAPTLTSIARLQAQAATGTAAAGVIRAYVVSLAGSANGNRIVVTDGTARLDLWCPASVGSVRPIIERRFEFDVTLRPGQTAVGDVAKDLGQVERATRAGDLRSAVALATPLYDRIFRTPAAAQASGIRLVG